MRMHWLVLVFVASQLATGTHSDANEDLIADFEATDYKGWTITGEAFGKAPARGTLPNQMHVSGFRGAQLVNTFRGGDETIGTATSREFKIHRDHIAFLIGGGSDHKRLGIELIIQGKSVRSSTGTESEHLTWESWDVSDYKGETARIRIYDLAKGGWGHLCVDHIYQTDVAPKRFDLESRLVEYRKSANYMNESLRPQYHFSPEINWMNDPNGLVYHDGEYHLFHQYNPAGNQWGHMSWGHAISRDLVHWKHMPLAIPEANGEMAFSGCCVIDHENTSGFGKGKQPPMVAIYTGHGRGKQVQNLAFSTDKGRSWKKYKQNPVLDINNANFRDPKVFWHRPSRKWVMVVSLAVEKVLLFYGSKDLKTWNELSRFGPAGTSKKSNWECPDLFQLPVEGDRENPMWVLEVDMGSGSVAGGSGGEYFVGEFDGTHFKAVQDAQWVDFGRDFYAPISWSNIPEQDGRRIWIGWFNNWETALVPTSPWRSCMSVPRTLSLRKIASNDNASSKYVLIQRPVSELKKLRTLSLKLDTDEISWPPKDLTKANQLSDMAFDLTATLRPGTARSLGFRIATGDKEFTEIGYDHEYRAVYVDRTHSGNVKFHPAFAGRHEAPTRLIDGELKLRILVDRSTVEVFINDGEGVISDRIFPSSNRPVIQAFAGDRSAKLEAELHLLKSIWRKK